MSTVSSPGELTREAMPDAPEGEWLDVMLQNRNEFIRQAVKAFKNGITNKDNTPNKEKELNLEHGVEYEVSNPMDVPVKGLYPLQCEGLSLDSMGVATGSTYALDMPTISWRPTGKPSGSVYVKATFPALSTVAAGQSIESTLGYLSGVTMSGTPANIVSISLTPGVWDVSALPGFYGNGGAPTGTALYACITTTSAILDGVPGDTLAESPTMPNAVASVYTQIVPKRVTVTATTPYYMVGQTAHTVGTIKGFGRLSANRVQGYSTGVVGRVNLFFYGG